MTYTEQNPKVSFVITGRNDDYGGNLINRANTFVKILSHLCDKYKLNAEIVWAEYNAVPGKKNLFEEVEVPPTPYLKLHGIVIPGEFHDRVKKNKIPLLEYYGKNIGIRRAKGEYILVTNPDIVFNDDMIKFIAEATLNPKKFYRADRYEIETNFFPDSMTPEQILTKCKKDVIKILYSPRTHYVSYKHWAKRIQHGWRNLLMCPALNFMYPPNRTTIYENASGDFLLAHRSLYAAVNGYDQAPHNLHHDALMLHVLKTAGFTQEILLEPFYHINHQEGRAGRPGIEYAKYLEIVKEMQATGKPYINNDKDWGFVNENFAEKQMN